LIVEERDISDLTGYAKNPRKNDHVVNDMAKFISTYGFRVPILCKQDGEIIDGHLRWKAAKKLKMKSVPVVYVDDMTETEIRAFRIAINKAAELAEFDMDLLTVEIEGLMIEGFDIDLTGFNHAEFGGVDSAGFPELPEGDKSPFQQITFTLSDEQAEIVKEAIQKSKDMGPFVSDNENGNGNAIARIAEFFLG